jgi:unsaturated chondroitin disaccharide hydrolase
MLSRIVASKASLAHGLPHWANPETGEWTVTADGDWTGGAYIGELWLARVIDPSSCSLEEVHHAMALMAPRVEMKTAF